MFSSKTTHKNKANEKSTIDTKFHSTFNLFQDLSKTIYMFFDHCTKLEKENNFHPKDVVSINLIEEKVENIINKVKRFDIDDSNYINTHASFLIDDYNELVHIMNKMLEDQYSFIKLENGISFKEMEDFLNFKVKPFLNIIKVHEKGDLAIQKYFDFISNLEDINDDAFSDENTLKLSKSTEQNENLLFRMLINIFYAYSAYYKFKDAFMSSKDMLIRQYDYVIKMLDKISKPDKDGTNVQEFIFLLLEICPNKKISKIKQFDISSMGNSLNGFQVYNEGISKKRIFNSAKESLRSDILSKKNTIGESKNEKHFVTTHSMFPPKVSNSGHAFTIPVQAKEKKSFFRRIF